MSTYISTQSAEKLLQDMMRQYRYRDESSSVYPGMSKLREVLTLLSDQQKLHILQQRYFLFRPLEWAAGGDDTEMISTLLTSLQSSAYRLKLLMVNDGFTPLHVATCCGHTESVKMILDCLTADQQIRIMSVQCGGETAIQRAERYRHTDTVRVLTEYQHRADNLMQRRKQQEQQRINEEKTRQRLSGINAQPIIGSSSDIL